MISDLRDDLKDVKCVWREDVWAERDDREETAEVREEMEERRE